MVTIKEIYSRRDLKKFIGFPMTLYKGNPYWVPPLIMDELETLDMCKNAAGQVCKTRYWLAWHKGKIVGRIAAIYNNKHFERWHKHQLRFGWFDFIDDIEVAEALMKPVLEWGQELAMESVIGPMGFTDMDKNGMLIEGFEEPGTYATLYNYDYYPKIMEKLGFQKDADWVEYRIKIPSEIPELIPKIAERTMKRYDLQIVNFKNSKEIRQYANRVFELIMETYRILYGFVDLTEEQVKQYTKKYINYLKPEYLTLIEDSHHQIVGFAITMPSMTRGMQKAAGRLFPFGLLHIYREMKKSKIIDLYLIGIKPRYQGKGITTVILNKMARNFISMGMEYAESNPELEYNKNVQGQWRFFERKQHKRRRVYIKPLE
jgi:GNAT superfamily N-acetyltransferase